MYIINQLYTSIKFLFSRIDDSVMILDDQSRQYLNVCSVIYQLSPTVCSRERYNFSNRTCRKLYKILS